MTPLLHAPLQCVGSATVTKTEPVTSSPGAYSSLSTWMKSWPRTPTPAPSDTRSMAAVAGCKQGCRVSRCASEPRAISIRTLSRMSCSFSFLQSSASQPPTLRDVAKAHTSGPKCACTWQPADDTRRVPFRQYRRQETTRIRKMKSVACVLGTALNKERTAQPLSRSQFAV